MKPATQETQGRPKLTEKGRRWVANLAVASAVAGGFALVTHESEPEAITREFSEYHLSDKYLDPANPLSKSEDVVIYSYHMGDTPTNIAASFGAKNMNQVQDEISGQAGGAGDLNPGMEVAVLPRDQLDPEMYTPEMVGGEALVTPGGIPYVEPKLGD